MANDPKARLKYWKAAQTWAIKSQHANRLSAMLALARSEPGIPVLPEQLNADPWLLNAANGTIDLRTGRLREHRREDFITALSPVKYDPAAACPTWERALNGIFPPDSDADDRPGDEETIGFVQRLFGYCATGVVRDKVLGVFWGTGDNGKSLVLNTVMDVLGPDYAVSLSSEFLMAHRGERHPTESANLFGKRLAVASESEQTDRLNEPLVKRLTGNDRISTRRMREDFWEFDPTHKLILMTNHKPRLTRGGDPAIWGRLKLIPFTVRFWDPAKPVEPGEERPAHLKADKELKEKLKSEYPGILAWLVRGCLRWQAEGLDIPKRVVEATATYKAEQDQVGNFIDEVCLTGEAFRVDGARLYVLFKAWIESSGERSVMTKRDFFAALRQRPGIESYTNNGVWFRGLCPREE
jgi:putative DNA primase/helicase